MDFRKGTVLIEDWKKYNNYYKILGPGPMDIARGRPKRTRILLALTGRFKGKQYTLSCDTIASWMRKASKAEEVLYV